MDRKEFEAKVSSDSRVYLDGDNFLDFMVDHPGHESHAKVSWWLIWEIVGDHIEVTVQWRDPLIEPVQWYYGGQYDLNFDQAWAYIEQLPKPVQAFASRFHNVRDEIEELEN